MANNHYFLLNLKIVSSILYFNPTVQENGTQECVAVVIGLYKKNGAVSCVGFDFVLHHRTHRGGYYAGIPY